MPAEVLPSSDRFALGCEVGCGRAFYHIQFTKSTPSSAGTGSCPPSTSPLYYGNVRAISKWEFLCYQVQLGELVYRIPDGMSSWLAGRTRSWKNDTSYYTCAVTFLLLTDLLFSCLREELSA